MRWLIEAGWFLGRAAILLLVVALLFQAAKLYIGREPAPEPDPQPDPPSGRRSPPTPVVFHDTPAPANYHRRPDQMHQWEVPAAVTAELDLAEELTAKLATFVQEPEPDPLDDTVELPVYADETPLYYKLRPPVPLRLESFTQGWSRDELQARIREAAKEMAP